MFRLKKFECTSAWLRLASVLLSRVGDYVTKEPATKIRDLLKFQALAQTGWWIYLITSAMLCAAGLDEG